MYVSSGIYHSIVMQVHQLGDNLMLMLQGWQLLTLLTLLYAALIAKVVKVIICNLVMFAQIPTLICRTALVENGQFLTLSPLIACLWSV